VTLHYSLARIAQLLAPWSPFTSDKLWRGLTQGMDEAVSVHLSDWPEAQVTPAEGDLITQMQEARVIVTDGLAERAAAGIKVRQPLASLMVPAEFSAGLVAIIAEEVNVKVVKSGKKLQLDTKITAELKAEGAMREIVRRVQNVRKESGLAVDDRIILTLTTESSDLAQAIKTHEAVIMAETLAVKLVTAGSTEQVPVKIDGSELYIRTEKAAS
jgi:isoleucyl-tRNA synthetase